MSDPKKVVAIGLDAGDRDLILRWSAEGLLPNLGRLLETGAWGKVSNPDGLGSGCVWHSFHTGISPARHGFYSGNRYLDPDTYKYRFYSESDVLYDPLWVTLSRSGKRVAVIDAPDSYLTKDINGINLMDWARHEKGQVGDVGPMISWPPELAADIEARFGTDPFGEGTCDGLQPRSHELEAFCEMLIDRATRKGALSRYLLEQENWDYYLTVFTECHCIMHHTWHLHDPTHPRHDPDLVKAIGGDPIKRVYQSVDSAVGRLLEAVGPDALVLLYCSNGAAPHYTGSNLLDQILLRLDGIKPLATRQRLIDRVRSLWRAAPRPLRNLLMPLRARFWDTIHDNANIAKPHASTRRYFETGNNYEWGGVRINLVGRESKGRVKPGSEYDDLCRELIDDLRAVINLETGQPLVQDIFRSADVYEGECVSRLPDLLVRWNRAGPIGSVSSPKIGTVPFEETGWRTGAHGLGGLFIASGPGIVPGQTEDPVQVYDFAPTVARVLGVEWETPDGRAIPALCDQLTSVH